MCVEAKDDERQTRDRKEKATPYRNMTGILCRVQLNEIDMI
jgi:hypothetical protein